MDQIDIDSPLTDDSTTTVTRSIEDLTMLEMFRMLLRHPFSTIRALSTTLRSAPVLGAATPGMGTVPMVQLDEDFFDVGLWWQRVWSNLRSLLPLLAALIIGLIGSQVVLAAEDVEGFQTLKFGGLLMLVSAAIMAVVTLRNWHTERLPALSDSAQATITSSQSLIGRYGLRLALFGTGLLMMLGSWAFNVNNEFSSIGVLCWVVSIVAMTSALLDMSAVNLQWMIDHWKALRIRIERGISLRPSWTLLALVVILWVGIVLRLGNLTAAPPDMTSDHVEKLLDAVKIYEGQRPIFLPNNEGREVFQMYFLAILKSVTGMPFNFDLLKLASGLEGVIGILLAYWMGRAIFGEEDRNLGNLTGLIMAALVATSFWHILLSRLALRIILTTLVSTLVFIFLARALRYNRRIDYIITGLILGAGLYTYQAVRMLPLVVLTGVFIAILMRARSWTARREYVVNLIALILVAATVFIPLWHYMSDNASEFWLRTSGRIFGDDATLDADGNYVFPSTSERLETLRKNLPVLAETSLRSVLMFNWRGDASWFNGASARHPAMDFFTGTMFILGLGVLLVRIFRRRDPVDLLLVLGLLIMLLPSALAIAFVGEVPGFTRASGSLPMAYLIAALGLALIVRLIMAKTTLHWLRNVLYAVLLVLLLVGAFNNYDHYFVSAMSDYRVSTLPHRQAGHILRGFIDSTGAPGNAFILAYQYWWDHRAVAIESGDPHWPNGIADTTNLADQIKGMMKYNLDQHKYVLRPDRQLLFFYHHLDTPTQEALKQIFPQGQAINIPSFNIANDFFIFVAPPVGCTWARENVDPSFPDCPEGAP